MMNQRQPHRSGQPDGFDAPEIPMEKGLHLSPEPVPQPAAPLRTAPGHSASPTPVAPDPMLGQGTGELTPAPFWKRLVAEIVDYMLMYGLSYVAFLAGVVVLTLASVLVTTMGGSGAGKMAMGIGFVLLLIVTTLSSVAYYAFLNASPLQGTLGKVMLGIKVVDTDGARIGYWHAFGRYFAKGLLMVFTLCVSLLFPLFTARKQALHDKLCAKLVVNRK